MKLHVFYASMPGFRPGGRPTFLSRQESRQRNGPCSAAPRCARGSLRFSVAEAAANSLRSLRSLRSNRGRESVLEACCARASAPCDARRLQRGRPQQPNSQGKTRQSFRSGCSFTPPLAPLRSAGPQARARSAPQALTRDACLSVVSATNEASSARGLRAEHRKAPRATRGAGRSGATLCLLSGRSESRSAAGPKSRHRA